jgi:hypothetical protein
MTKDGYGIPDPTWRRHQRALNAAFPRDARSIPNQAEEIDVWVRVVWERDGEIWHMGRATRWTDAHVFVEFGDERLATIGVWIKPEDVRRR